MERTPPLDDETRDAAAPDVRPAPAGPGSGPASPWWAPGSVALDIGLVVVLALLVRLIHLDHTGFVDEFNHVLAGQSLLEDGDLLLLDGATRPYDRGLLFTLLVALSQAVLGATLVAARVPALLAGVALVGAVHAGTARLAGRGAGLLAGLLVALDPGGIALSQMARFYTLHALLLWVGGLAVYRATTEARARPLVLAALLFAAALHLQRTTVIGIGGIGLAAAGLLAVDPRGLMNRRRWLVLGGIMAVGGVGAWLSGAAQAAWGLFRYADPWGDWSRNYVLFYSDILMDRYPLLWLAFPLLAVLALARQGRAAFYVGTVFAVALAAQSAAAWKAERYFYYAMPWFFAVAGMGAAEVLGWAGGVIGGRARALAVRPRTAALAVAAVLGAVLAWWVAGQPAYRYTARMLLLDDDRWAPSLPPYRGHPDWQAAADSLEGILTAEDVLLTSKDVAVLQVFGRLDAVVSVTGQAAHTGGGEFERSDKLGVPMFRTPGSLDLVVRCNRSGMLLVDGASWRSDWGVPDATADVVESSMTEIPLPPGWEVRAYRWRGEPGADCPPGATLR